MQRTAASSHFLQGTAPLWILLSRAVNAAAILLPPIICRYQTVELNYARRT